jgi:hypothetical protein
MELTEVVVKFLQDIEIDLLNCRGQSYDNASNMSGHYEGLQARIKELNELAIYAPCAGHSLNLVGVNAVSHNGQVTNFFNFIQKLYTFFVQSTHRWNVLVSSLGPEHCVLKRLSDTRWSAYVDAIKALYGGYELIKSALNIIEEDASQSREARHEASSLIKRMKKLETVFLTIIWNEILNRFNETSKTVQKENIDLQVVIKIINSLKFFIQSMRERFGEYEILAKEKTENAEYSNTNKRKQQRSKRFFDGPAEETFFCGSENFKINTYLPIMDSLIDGLSRRNKAYENVYNKFRIFSNLKQLDLEEIKVQVEPLASFYPNDLNKEELISEFIQFKYYMFDMGVPTIASIYSKIKTDLLESTFPNIEIAARIFLSIMVTNCSGERSFSKLKHIKDELRNSTQQNRLNALSIMSIESEVLEEIDFTDIVMDFAHQKARKRPLNI